MADQEEEKLDPALSNRLAKALKVQDNIAYTPEVRQLAQQLLFGENEGHYGIWEDAPEDKRTYYLREAAQRLQQATSVLR